MGYGWYVGMDWHPEQHQIIGKTQKVLMQILIDQTAGAFPLLKQVALNIGCTFILKYRIMEKLSVDVHISFLPPPEIAQ
tara:strand:+ start:34007 stop:34243 length:237 start_codon:yes stop_codon:yes gene_type:complete